MGTNPCNPVDLVREAAALRLFGLVCELPADEASRALLQLAGEDASVVGAVERLLAADRRAAAPFDGADGTAVGKDLLLLDLARSMLGGRAGAERTDAPLPERIGAYRVLGRLGAGGMGVVYEAEQRQPRRRVAIKLVHPGMLSPMTLEAFRHEADVLARLADPTIPTVFEAGEHDGVPYIVMELVRGRPIDRHLFGRPGPERLALLLDVVLGVHKAHEAGIVHADLTPNNILVTVEGGPKIIDFGLAISGPTRRESPAGTRGYMAPEQRRPGHHPDRRTDVYALGVLTRDLLAADGELPRELRCVVARATAPDPAARYPSAAALADDLRRYRDHYPVTACPDTPGYRLRKLVQRHPRFARAVALVVTVGALAAALVSRSATAAREAHEDRAAARLVAVEARMGALRAAGDHAAAEAVFRAFEQLPENAGTRALYDAWMRRGERLELADTDASEAFALAFTTGRRHEERQLALERLAESFARRADWRSLHLALTKLGEFGASSPTIDRLTRSSAAWRRDFAALAPTADDPTSVAAAWARAHPLGLGVQLGAVTRWRGEEAFYVLTPAGRSTWWSRASPPTLLADAPLPEGAVVGERFPRPVADAGGWLLGADRADRTVLWTWEVAPDGGGILVPRYSAALGRLHAATGWAGATWDAAPVAFLGTGGQSPRTLYTLRPRDPGGADFILTEVAADVRSPASDVDDLRLEDVDGDGDPELLMLLGPWRAYDLRVIDLDDETRLRLRARVQLGAGSHITALTVAGERLIAVNKKDRYPNPDVLGQGSPHGAPRGVHLFALGPDGLDHRAHLPFPTTVGGVHTTSKLLAGDVDGDGLEDLAAGVSAVDGDVLVVFQQRPGGRFDPVVVGGAAPELLLQLDDDPALELLVRLGDAREGWILGAGEQAPPAVDPVDTRGGREVSAHLLAWGGDPALARIARGAGELVQLGMLRVAAQRLLRGAEVATGPGQRARLLIAAGQLFELLDEPHRAAPIFERALAGAAGAPPVEALAGAARAHLAEHDLGRAVARLEQLRRVGAGDEVSRWAEERLEALRPHVSGAAGVIELVGPGALHEALEVVAPHAIGRRAVGGALRVDALSGLAAIARVPVRYDGGALGVGLTISVEHLEIGAGLEVALRHPERPDVSALRLGVSARGGGRYVKRFTGCRIPVPDGSAITGHEPEGVADTARVRLRFDAVPDAGEGTCRVWHGDAPWPVLREVVPLPRPLPGDYELVLRGEGRALDGGLTLLRATLESVELVGLTPIRRSPTPLVEAHQRYASLAWRDALRRYDLAAPGSPWGLMAALDVERDEALAERLRGLLSPDVGPDHQLLELLRLRPGRLGRVWAGVDPEGFVEAFAQVWATSVRYLEDPETVRVLSDPVLDDLGVGANGAASDAVVRLAVARADLLLASGDASRAAAALTSVLALPEDERQAPLLAEARLVAARASLAAGDEVAARGHLARWRTLEADPRPGVEILSDRPRTASLAPFLP